MKPFNLFQDKLNNMLRKAYNHIFLFFLRIVYRILLQVTDLVIYLHWRLWKYDLSGHDIINSSVPGSDIKIGSHDGYHHITASHIKKRYHVFQLKLDNGIIMECADDHLICDHFGHNIPVQNLRKGHHVCTKDGGTAKVISVKKKNYRCFMFDVTVASKDQLYNTNGILSHNSIITAIFMTWYLLTNIEKNILIVSQSGSKVKELMSKIEVILKALPFYMKPGMITNNVMTKVFDSGCKLVAETTTDKSGASFTIHLLYADEFALVHHSYINEFFRTIFPTLSSSDISRMIITSTPRGMNKFYEIYNSAIKSENRFNPIRVDWYEVPLSEKELLKRGHSKEEIKEMQKNGTVPYRDDEWKAIQVGDLGSEEDFNQEFGNQFLAGNQLLFQSSVLKRLKRYQTKFIHHDIEIFDAADIPYEGLLTWHPKFDEMNIINQACQFAFTIDLGDGNGGDYSVINIFQVLPMSKKEIDQMQVYTEEKDFFKLVQVGMFRSNTTPIPELAKMFYHLITEIFIQGNCKAILENNHEGNYFRKCVETIYGEDNILEDDHLWVKFKKRMDDEKSQIWLPGLTNTEKTKDYACKVIKDKVKHNQLIPMEYITVEEGLSFAKNKKGKYESQTGNDDSIMTCVNITHFFETMDFVGQCEGIIQFIDESFTNELDVKLNRFTSLNGEDDYTDLF